MCPLALFLKLLHLSLGHSHSAVPWGGRAPLQVQNCEVTVVPFDYDLPNNPEAIQYDGIFLSNGPGNPQMVQETVASVRWAITRPPAETKPLFGICLGNQVLALAAGGGTYKMKYGNRGANQPCIDMRTGRCYITPQNHGFAVDGGSLPEDWKTFFLNANDFSNEGVIHASRPFFSVQFHPEAAGGPTDTAFLFDMFVGMVKGSPRPQALIDPSVYLPAQSPARKVLVLGSGGLSIGQAGEFDYSGSQAIKALKEEGVEVILINPNIATVQTSQDGKGGAHACADTVYFLPVSHESALRVIEKERPDSIVVSMGGQTALNVGVKLFEAGDLARLNVRVLGTQIPVIIATEDREIFSEKLAEINEALALSYPATTVDGACDAAARIGYPVLVRAAFALGGLGSGFADDEAELRDLAEKAFSVSGQILIDMDLRGWKEVEYEVVRDCRDNCVTVCNMENFDPLGVHTGDSIVVAPSQTLSNREYYKLRQTALKVVRHLGVVGECNIQYALNPHSEQYCIIEVNARLSRSSALASKATGYPLAYVAAKLSLGKDLVSIRNSVTKTTTACFEPSLDYCVVKMPRWDLHKFPRVSHRLGSSMISVGEVMAVGRSFEEAIQKAVRMVAPGSIGLEGGGGSDVGSDDGDGEQLAEAIRRPTDRRLFQVQRALELGWSVDRLHDLSRIDRWYLQKLKNIQLCRRQLEVMGAAPPGGTGGPGGAGGGCGEVGRAFMLRVKQLGFSDLQVAKYLSAPAGSGASPPVTEATVRRRRQQLGVVPVVKQIDTLAAEFPAQTNYLYMTYHGTSHDVSEPSDGVVVLGCGCYCIGSSVEFDWSAVSAVRTIRAAGLKAVVINFNPETVSTDYDESDRLYFEELSFERVTDIYEHERSGGVIVSVGGQIAQNVCAPLKAAGVRVLGTDPDDIDRAEDRHKFSALLDAIGVDQPAWRELATVDDAVAFADEVAYPVLVRPSFVLSGAAMNVAANRGQLVRYLRQAATVSGDKPVVVTKFITNAKEIEFDAVASGGKVLNYAISEHIENAGVHSGDATLVLPAQKLYQETVRRVKKIGQAIAAALNITGPFNIQLMAKANDIKVIECNLRASRTFPFVSKTLNANFITLATKAMLGLPARPYAISLGDIDYVGVKCPMFSFTRLRGADPILGVEMSSTGEVACFGDSVHEAFRLALEATGFKMPAAGSVVLVSIAKSDEDSTLDRRYEFREPMRALLRLGFALYGTPGTADYYQRLGIPVVPVAKPKEEEEYGVEGGEDGESGGGGGGLKPSASTEALGSPAFLGAVVDPRRVATAAAAAATAEALAAEAGAGPSPQLTRTTVIDTDGLAAGSSGGAAAAVAKLPSAIDLIKSGRVGLVINVPEGSRRSLETQSNGYLLRRTTVDFGVSLLTNVKVARMFVDAEEKHRAALLAGPFPPPKSIQEFYSTGVM